MLKMTPFGLCYCVLLVGLVAMLASKIPWVGVIITFLLFVIIAICWSLFENSQHKARALQGSITARTHNGTLVTKELVAEVKRQLSAKKDFQAIAEALNISPATVKKIKTGFYDGIASWPEA